MRMTLTQSHNSFLLLTSEEFGAVGGPKISHTILST